jgi:hypothetical protein
MIATKNSVFLHVPKTAGKWVASVLSPITMSAVMHLVPTTKPSQPNVFCFVRNSWDWYVSYYQFHKTGSEMFSPTTVTPLTFRKFYGNESFEEFVSLMTNPSDEFKTHFNNVLRLNKMSKSSKEIDHDQTYMLDQNWLNSNDSFYFSIFKMYSRFATRVGKFENLRDDLISILIESDELTSEVEDKINNTDIINKTLDKADYQQYYTTTSRDQVEKASALMIEEFGYKF